MSATISSRDMATAITDAAHRISATADYDDLIELAGPAGFVLIGEASHGTHEFYARRAELTRRLIAEKNFRIVALEADWPDMLRVHRYVAGRAEERNAAEALSDFRRFPAWMWRNTVMVEFVEWLRDWNQQRQAERERAGMFGLDLYSMHASIDSVLRYLDKVDPAAARRARHRYGCFEFFGEDPQAYGYATTRGQLESCEDEVVAQLADLRRKYGDLMSRDGQVAEDEFFYAEQNARLVANAERYYRSMFRGRDTSWNLRDQHMVETLQALVGHFDSGRSKIIVWAHNSHLGDARATQMSERGEWNVGQLARERYGREVFSIGFSTYSGTVTAASDWGGTAERKRVLPALAGSYEELFHNVGVPRFWLNLRERNDATELLRARRLERAIGVIYRPETERWSHYFEACLPEQFDAIVHLDETRALEPLERSSEWECGELPETYPEGL
ncbi:MAG: erythromycin esterase [Verrucomicrobia bacterium]|nr:MAG: erythromycin esterase [Verrucomicrobiota bacterium]